MLCEYSFLEGNFRGAVLDAFIHLIDAVKNKTGLPYEGDDLMNKAFSSKDGHPVVMFNELRSDAEKNEQNGIWWLFRGVVGMRNYKAHKVTPFDDPHRAHEYLALAKSPHAPTGQCNLSEAITLCPGIDTPQSLDLSSVRIAVGQGNGHA